MGKNWTRRGRNHHNTKEWKWSVLPLGRRERQTTTRVDMMGILNAKGNRENIRKTWGEAKKIAKNRVRWRDMVETLCLTRGK